MDDELNFMNVEESSQPTITNEMDETYMESQNSDYQMGQEYDPTFNDDEMMGNEQIASDAPVPQDMTSGMDFSSEPQTNTPTCPVPLSWHPGHSLCLNPSEEECGMGEIYDQDMAQCTEDTG